MNTNEVTETLEVLLENIKEAKLHSRPFDTSELFIISENLLSCLASLVGPLMDAETAYRAKTAWLVQEGDPASKAEIKAKATSEYNFYRKLQYACELAQEQIMLLKKFADKMEFEKQHAR